MSDQVLDLIDETIADTGWILGEDAASWKPEPTIDTHGRVPYQVLDPHEQEALHAWCQLHGIDHQRVPIDGLIELDPAVNEWRIETYRLRDGNKFIGQDGDIARAVLRRARKADLPWRRP